MVKALAAPKDGLDKYRHAQAADEVCSRSLSIITQDGLHSALKKVIYISTSMLDLNLLLLRLCHFSDKELLCLRVGGRKLSPRFTVATKESSAADFVSLTLYGGQVFLVKLKSMYNNDQNA